MAILKCKMCGGDIILDGEKTFGTCEYCGSTMTLPKVSDEQRAALFNRGNHFRRTGDFDKALAIYENIVREDDTDAEAHWCCVLCRFGIEYVEDPNTYEFVPTCHRASFDSILEDVDYLATIEHSDGITRRQYQKEAAKIAEVQKGILATSQNEEPFDIFICYKETDDTTKQRTKDSLDAQEIYYQLTNEGYRVFFSRITLEDKAGAEYEPYIFAALNSAKIMVVIGSKPEYFNAVWVKNEWNRFLALMRKDRSKILLPCYKGMDPYDLPEALSVLQSYDMSKIGFIQDLIRGIKKVIKTDEPKKAAEGTVVAGIGASVVPLLKRAFMFLEDGAWDEADEYCEKVLDQDPENAQAYLGKLMAELMVNKKEQLADCDMPYDDLNNYRKALRFANSKLASELTGYIDHINERNENTRRQECYEEAKAILYSKDQYGEEDYKEAAEIFGSIPGYKDADELAAKCLEKAEKCHRQAEIEAEAQLKMAEQKAKETEWKVSSVIYAMLDQKLNEMHSKENKLLEKQSRLGIFSGKEKKWIDEELAALAKKKSDLTEQLEQAHANAKYKYGFEEACDIYLKESDVAAAVNNICPAAGCIPAIMGKTDTIYLGNYSLEEVGLHEPIEWQVLARVNGRMLVISKYALNRMQFSTSFNTAFWNRCTLREWLNGSFLNNMFSENERSIITNSYVNADKNPKIWRPGVSTKDHIFLLSITEAEKYFSSNSDRQCKGKVFCYESGTYQKYRNYNCSWWLRTDGDYHHYCVAYVNHDGTINYWGIQVDSKSGVRPAMWISLE